MKLMELIEHGHAGRLFDVGTNGHAFQVRCPGLRH